MAKILFVVSGEENLGVEYLSAALKQAGHITFLIFDSLVFSDPNSFSVPALAALFDFQKDIKNALQHERPDMVCFSANTSNYRWALAAAAFVRTILEDVVIVFGGVHPTAVPDRVIIEAVVDVCCVGEGEEALVELAGAIDSRSEFSSIPNLWVKSAVGVIKNPVRMPVKDLDSLPFPDKNIYYRDYGFMFPGYIVVASRGCPFSCAYCHSSVVKDIYRGLGSFYRRRSPENVLAELESALKKHKPRYIRFEDEVFTCNKDWLRRFLPLYKEKIGLPFDCSLHPRSCDDETVAMLKMAGCAVAHMGVQSLNAGLRASVLDRHYSNEEACRAIKAFRQAGIFIACDNIFGVPGQDEGEMRETVSFYLNNTPDYIAVYWLNYYPRTKITALALKKGLITTREYNLIETGFGDKDNVRGGISYREDFAAYQQFLTLVVFLPKAAARFLINKDRFKRLPRINAYWLMVLNRVINRPPFDIYPERTVRRYFFSVWMRFRSIFSRRSD